MIAEHVCSRFLGLYGALRSFFGLSSWLASVLPDASLSHRSQCFAASYGLNMARLTHTNEKNKHAAATKRLRSARRPPCAARRAWAISLKSDKNSPVPPLADSFAVGNRPMTSI